MSTRRPKRGGPEKRTKENQIEGKREPKRKPKRKLKRNQR